MLLFRVSHLGSIWVQALVAGFDHKRVGRSLLTFSCKPCLGCIYPIVHFLSQKYNLKPQPHENAQSNQSCM